MNDDLFADMPPVKSPRLIWMEAHNITTERKASSQGAVWIATANDETESAAADCEHDALVKLAIKLGIKLWNE